MLDASAPKIDLHEQRRLQGFVLWQRTPQEALYQGGFSDSFWQTNRVKILDIRTMRRVCYWTSLDRKERDDALVEFILTRVKGFSADEAGNRLSTDESVTPLKLLSDSFSWLAYPDWPKQTMKRV